MTFLRLEVFLGGGVTGSCPSSGRGCAWSFFEIRDAFLCLWAAISLYVHPRCQKVLPRVHLHHCSPRLRWPIANRHPGAFLSNCNVGYMVCKPAPPEHILLTHLNSKLRMYTSAGNESRTSSEMESLE